MTMESAEYPPRWSFRRVLPWVVAAAALAFYVWTLNPWVSFSNLIQVSRLSGWNWQEEICGPLFWLISFPLRWLPVRLVPVGLNLFSATCGALSLALLARSVMLLPHDRTHEQRQKEKSEFSLLSIKTAWIPPVLAVLVCGLQMTFWQNATASACDWLTLSSNQMFDLLFFAYIIRCVLESRIDEDRPWLTRASFVYGLAITNNWAMIAFFPLFITALIWIRGLSFFNQRFLARMFLWACAGLLLYLLLPIVQSTADISRVPFWDGLARNIKLQRSALAMLPFNKPQILSGDHPMWVLGLSSLLPVLMMSIRWPSYFGDPSRIGVAISTFILHLAYAALMLLCIWVAFGSQLSPNHQLALSTPNHILMEPALTLYYLGALSVGYFAGYFLVVFSNPAERSRRIPGYVRFINSTVHAAVWLLLIATPLLLFARNLPQIRQYNGPAFDRYATAMLAGLPPNNTFILGDDPVRLLLVRSALARAGRSDDYVFVDTASLVNIEYHKFLLKKHGSRWPVDLKHEEFYSAAQIKLLTRISESNHVYYLHPSVGYFFEAFYPVPHGLVCELNSYPTNSLLAPPTPDAVLNENEAFWAKHRPEAVEPLANIIDPPPRKKSTDLMSIIVQRLHLITEEDSDAIFLGTHYSRALVYWGTELQKAGRYTKAESAFELAGRMNPGNVVATINLACNKSLQTGVKTPVIDRKAVEDQFGNYRTWSAVVSANGPFDDPGFCYGFGGECVRGRLYRQAAEQFARVKTLAPGNLRARLFLAQIYLQAQMPDDAMKLIKEIKAQPDVVGLGRSNRAAVLSVEVSALLARKNIPAVDSAIQEAMKEYPLAADLPITAGGVLAGHALYTNALPYVERAIKLAPDNPDALLAQGYLFLQLHRYAEVIPSLTRYLTVNTNKNSQEHYNALVNRGIAYLQTGQLDEAQRDYEEVQKAVRSMYQVDFALGEIAWRRNDTNAAIRHYQHYLNNSPENPEEIKTVKERLKQLQHGSS